MAIAEPGCLRSTRFDFLAGGGEMGAAMRAYDWASTPLGQPDDWPAMLKTILRLLLTSQHPMLVWWGADLIQFYNDAYTRTVGPELHAHVLGQSGQECWQEIWDFIGPDIQHVMAGKGAIWHEEKYVPLIRGGIKRDFWWTYGFSPIEDEHGVQGVLVTCHDVTQAHASKENLTQLNQNLVDEIRVHKQARNTLEEERDRIGAALDVYQDSLAQQVRDWQELHDLGTKLWQARTLQSQLAIVLDTVTRLHGCNQGVISLFDSAKNGLVTQASTGISASGLAQLTCVPIGAGACGTAFREGRCIMVEDTETDPLYDQYRGFAREQGIRAVCSVPFFTVAGEPLGVLSVYFPTPGKPNERQRHIVDICIAKIALLVERDNTLQRLQSVMEESERWRRLYDTILSNTPDLAYVFDLNHRFTYANEILLKMWGKTLDEAIGKNCLELGYEPWHAEMHSREIEQVRATKQPIRGEVPFTSAFGRRIYDYIFVPVFGPDGEVEAVAGTTRDVTERKENEEALREANARKDEFLAMLAHELRNPLAPISTAAQLIKIAGGNADMVRRSGEIITRQVRHMTELVDDLLDVSRVTRGLVQLEKAAVDIKSIVGSALEQARPLIESKCHSLSTHVTAAQTIVHGDKTRLIQIISNLLNNAAKYTPQNGQITLTVGVEGGQVMVSVADNGIGIEPGLLPHVFELFIQAKRTPDRAQGGLGLGLALVSSLVAMHGGRVEAQSAGLGKGCTFTMYLPASDGAALRQAETERPSGAAGPAHALDILIVDDNRDAAESLASLLGVSGHAVKVEIEAQMALRTAFQQVPDVLVLDIGLPDMSGYELARKLRENPATAKSMLIALTGYGQAHDRRLSELAGFDHHFVKPVDIGELELILKKAAS